MTVIVMTGGTAGIGAVAAHQLAASARLIVGARPGTMSGTVAGAEMLPLDLASLASVRAFAAGVIAATPSIDALVLNAGGQRGDIDTRSQDGYELTFATNHLAHYLLARLLLPHIREGGRLVITTSDTHDPRHRADRFGIPPPRHADARLLAHPETDPGLDSSPVAAGMRAYSTSKLANLMTVRSLAALPEVAARRLTVLAYNPGLTPGTGLARTRSWPLRYIAWPLMSALQPLLAFMNSRGAAGGALAALATRQIPPPGRLYASLVAGKLTWPDGSALANDDAATAKLWADSAALVGLDG